MDWAAVMALMALGCNTGQRAAPLCVKPEPLSCKPTTPWGQSPLLGSRGKDRAAVGSIYPRSQSPHAALARLLLCQLLGSELVWEGYYKLT